MSETDKAPSDALTDVEFVRKMQEWEVITIGNYERLLSLALRGAETQEVQVENRRLREAIADIHNTINIVGSPYDQALKAIDEMASSVKKKARAAIAALGSPKDE